MNTRIASPPLRPHSSALALAIHGHLRGFLNKEHEAALNILERAIAIGPSCALAWTFNSYVCGWIGEPAAAVERARQGLRLSPIGPDAGCWHEHALSQAYYMAGEYDEAIAWARTAASHGRQQSNLRCLAASLVAVDRIDEARTVAHLIIQARPDFNLKVYQSQTPLRGQIADLFVDRLRRAGLETRGMREALVPSTAARGQFQFSRIGSIYHSSRSMNRRAS